MKNYRFSISNYFFVLTACFAFGVSPAVAYAKTGCYQNFPEWDRASEVSRTLRSASAISDSIKTRLLDRFEALQQRHDSYVNGTAPACSRFFDFQSKNDGYEEDVGNYNHQFAIHENNVRQFNSECSVIHTIEEQNSCQSWANQINARKSELDDWLSKINTQKQRLDEMANDINRSADAINSEWKSLLNSFIADANEAMKLPTLVVASWSGNWDNQEKALVHDALLGLRNKGLRNWISENVQFNRSVPDGVSPLSANGSVLKFKDDFFTETTMAKRENLIAFEAGKAFWNKFKDESVEGDKSLMTWFAGFSADHRHVIEAMKAAKHRNEGFGRLGDIDAPSQFAYIFRAQALQLNKPREQNAQREWDMAVREFQARIGRFLREK